jgi:monofunctional biosynthetic peptidoglycan transglycosylase
MRAEPRYAAPRAYHHNVSKRGITRLFNTLVLSICGLIVLFYLLAVGELIALRWIDPPTTTVQVQRRVEAWIGHRPYRKRYRFVPLANISPQLQHAVIAAEDGRFYQHRGVDWKEVEQVIDQDIDTGRVGRGASTITQQLVKNLFLTTHRSFIRKGVEFTLAPVMERVLSKQRILELYLNVIEWGPGVYGAEEAARTWYGIPAARVNREQAARLAALIPSPLRRKPARMTWYSTEIIRRMSQRGW